MFSKSCLYLLSITLFLIAPEINATDESTYSRLVEDFKNPPPAARPRAYWAWMNGNTDLPQLTYELEEMKAKGLGGLDIFDIGANDPNKVIPAGPAFMGPESVKAIAHAVREASRLGLEMGLITSSSWNAGGPWVKPEYGVMGIFYSTTSTKGSSHFDQNLPFPSTPKKSPKRSDGLPAYYKDIATLGIPKSNNKSINDFKSIIDLTGNMQEDGRLVWDVPSGEWDILRFICACTGERLVLPSPQSDGLIIDHFNPVATEMHFNYIIAKLQEELGDLGKTALKILYLPSYEVTSYDKEKGLIWTPRLREEFQNRRGYDLAVYLPLLFGYTAADSVISQRFLFDFTMTLSDLIIENHYQKAREICRANGLLLCSEAGGPGQPLHNCPFEALRALGALDIPRGEFWYKHQRFDENGNDILWLVKEIACASHIYGKPIVDGESFTSWYHWQTGPFDLKPLADRAMCEGQNRFTFHTSSHNPPAAGKPGWVYHAGTHINTNLVWWPKIKPFIDYLARCCYLLQTGLFVGDVCYYYGDQAPNFVKPKHTDPSLGVGYDYDVVNSEVILSRMNVKDGRIVLPDGMSYELLVLPERDDMNPAVLKKLVSLIEQGAVVVGPKPTRSSGLKDYQFQDKIIREYADKLWDTCDGKQVKEHTYGKGKIVWGRNLRGLLQERGVGSDFTYIGSDRNCNLDYIHRRTTKADIYFINNKSQNWVGADCTFRVSNLAPELWQPDTGDIQKTAVYESTEAGTKLPLRLPPAGSVFVVFREKADPEHIVSLSPGLSDLKISQHDKEWELSTRKAGAYTIKTNTEKSKTIEIKEIPNSIAITGSWEVHFPPGWGAPEVKVFPQLTSWTESSEDGIKYFSGIAAYQKDFVIPTDLVEKHTQFILDLGTVKNMADVQLNGKPLGILWKPPFQFDITACVKPGNNQLSIQIANLWSNRLVGDALHPEGKRYTNTNITYSIMWEQLWTKTPLLESGLLGPVRIHIAKVIHVPLD